MELAPLTKNRISSIDLLKGIVMVIMALDHTRDYFHAASFVFSPEDIPRTTVPIFFTRWITHFCAPAFSFLAGISAFMVGRRKSKGELSKFLLTRGIWLVFIELTIVNFAWYFDVQFRSTTLAVIWALGISMIVLAGVIHLPRKLILLFSCIVIFGHDLLDTIHFKDSIPWAIIHDGGFFEFTSSYHLAVVYPVIPWFAVMSLGYYFGFFYNSDVDRKKRKKIFNIIGVTSIVLFILLRYLNFYGDPVGWKHYDTTVKEFLSFIDPIKYPPSLLFLLMTLGVTFIFLANIENPKGKVVNFFSTYGRVPFFYYILHIYLIHIIAMIFAEASGYGWDKMILPDFTPFVPALKGFGYPLVVVYAVWISVIIILYPVCKAFDKYKLKHKGKRWLSYL